VFAEASTYAKRALELDPQNSHLLAQMGRLLLLAGNAREAKVYLTRAEQLGHLAPEIRQALAEVRQRLGETRSINELEAAIAASPNEPELYAALARRQLADNQLDEAQALLDQALARWPENVALVDALGRLQLIREDPQAHATLKRLVALAPSHWEAYHNLAVITVTRDPEQALHYARRAVALAPQKFETNYNLALMLIHNRQWQEALNLLRAIHAQLDAGDPLRAAAAERIEFVKKQMAGE
jgi:Flp pilus assembly protein TadD